jgi:hypothetical protein
MLASYKDWDEEDFGFATSAEDVLVEGNVADSILNHAAKHRIPSSWLLLDNQANLHIFEDQKHLNNIRTVNRRMRVNSHVGASITNEKGDFYGCGSVWYDPNGIVSLTEMQKRY